MASVFPGAKADFQRLALPSGRQLARGMSRHAAVAMLVFAVWQAALSMTFADVRGGSALPWAALVLLVLGAIPYARRMERRWQQLTIGSFPCPALVAAYRRDRLRLWVVAIAAPLLVMSLVLLISTLSTRFTL